MKRILVVDDDPSVADLMMRFLQPHGYEVDAAFSGGQAVGMLQANAYDLVVSDVRMPNGSGIDVLRELQKAPARIPVVLMSADMNGAKAQAKMLGAEAFLPKPYSDDQLLHTLSQVLTTDFN